MTPYPMALRERVLAACDDGMAAAAAAETFSVRPAWVRRVRQRRREAGEVAPRVATPGPAPVLAPHADWPRALVRDHPGRTAAESRDRRGAGVAVATVWRMPRRLGRTHKKGRSGQPRRTART